MRGFGEAVVEGIERLSSENASSADRSLVVITIAPPVRIFPLLRFGALVQIPMLSMSLVFPLIVVDSFLSTATRHHYGRSDRHCEQKWSEVLKQCPHDNSPSVEILPSRSKMRSVRSRSYDRNRWLRYSEARTKTNPTSKIKPLPPQGTGNGCPGPKCTGCSGTLTGPPGVTLPQNCLSPHARINLVTPPSDAS